MRIGRRQAAAKRPGNGRSILRWGGCKKGVCESAQDEMPRIVSGIDRDPSFPKPPVPHPTVRAFIYLAAEAMGGDAAWAGHPPMATLVRIDGGNAACAKACYH